MYWQNLGCHQWFCDNSRVPDLIVAEVQIIWTLAVKLGLASHIFSNVLGKIKWSVVNICVINVFVLFFKYIYLPTFTLVLLQLTIKIDRHKPLLTGVYHPLGKKILGETMTSAVVNCWTAIQLHIEPFTHTYRQA